MAQALGREFKRPDYLTMLHELTCTEFDNWAFYFSERHYFADLTEIGIGQITAAVFNATRNFKTWMKTASMMPVKHRPKTIQEQIAIWKALAHDSKNNS